MSRLEWLAGRWVDWAWNISWQFTVIVGLAAMLCWVLRLASPRVRHAVWLLVLLKALLPPTLAAPWAIGNWGVPQSFATPPAWSAETAAIVDQFPAEAADAGDAQTSAVAEHPPPPVWLMCMWATGALLFWAVVSWRYWRLRRDVNRLETVDEGPLRIELERLAGGLQINRVPDLHVTPEATSPLLIGVLHPRIVLPRSLVDGFDAAELRMVLLHELVHWRRRDTWIGCGQVLVQGLLWFHPLVWWASAQLRHEREKVCDDAVVRLGSVPARQYGELILRVLTTSQGRSQVAGSLVGVFERPDGRQDPGREHRRNREYVSLHGPFRHRQVVEDALVDAGRFAARRNMCAGGG